MKRLVVPGVLVVLLFLLGGYLQAGQEPENPFTGDAAAIEEGRGLLNAACGGYCHATTQGEATDAPDLFDCEWWHGDGDGDLFAVIRDGVPDTRMQGFGGLFPDDDIWRLITVIREDSRCVDSGTEDLSRRE